MSLVYADFRVFLMLCQCKRVLNTLSPNQIQSLEALILTGYKYHYFHVSILGDCYLDNPEVKALLDNATLPTLKDLDECLKQSKELICHLHHPICLHAKDKRKIYPVQYSYTSLYVCKETCVAGESLCRKTIQFMRAAEFIRHACPISKLGSDKLLIIPSCENLPKADIRYIEKCKYLTFNGKAFLDQKFF